MNKSYFIGILIFASMTDIMANTSKNEEVEAIVSSIEQTEFSGYQLVLLTGAGSGIIQSVELINNKTIRVSVIRGSHVRIDHRANGLPVNTENFFMDDSSTFEFEATTESFLIEADYNGESSSSGTKRYETRMYDLKWVP